MKGRVESAPEVCHTFIQSPGAVGRDNRYERSTSGDQGDTPNLDTLGGATLAIFQAYGAESGDPGRIPEGIKKQMGAFGRVLIAFGESLLRRESMVDIESAFDRERKTTRGLCSSQLGEQLAPQGVVIVIGVVGSADIRARNSSLVLRLMWEQKQISRADIARKMGLSRSTVSAIVSNLMDTGLLRSCGSGHSNGGRRPILLGFEDNAFLIVGAEIGATHIGVALTNLRAETQAWRYTLYPVRDNPEGTLQKLVELIHACVEELGAGLDRLVGIGIGVPSPIDPEHPECMSPLIHPRWAGVNLAEVVRRSLDVPVFIENDANLGALAERWWGAGRDGRDLAYIKVATGIGAGYIINNKIYRGAGGFAGEIGHTTISTNGRSGSLTSLIGTRALIARARELMEKHPNSLLAGSDVTIKAIISATQSGDILCRQLIDETGAYLGLAIANLLNLLNPATVVLGGAITSLDDLLLHPVHQAIRDRTLWAAIAQSKLVTSSLGEQAIAVGAATQVLQAALENHQLFPSTTVGGPN